MMVRNKIVNQIGDVFVEAIHLVFIYFHFDEEITFFCLIVQFALDIGKLRCGKLAIHISLYNFG